VLEEFKKFALRGNVLDLAVGIVIGVAFTAIVQSLVNDIIMPPIGVLMGGLDFSDYYVQLTMRDREFASLAEARAAGAAVIAYGSFVNAIVNFLIVAFALFLVIRQFNRLRDMMARPDGPTPAEAPPPPPEVQLLAEIRDILKGGAPSRPAPPVA
jgi:large conductance mechanosensitive channel